MSGIAIGATAMGRIHPIRVTEDGELVLSSSSVGGDASAANQDEQTVHLADILTEVTGVARDASVQAVTTAVSALGGGASLDDLVTTAATETTSQEILAALAPLAGVLGAVNELEPDVDATRIAVEQINAKTPALGQALAGASVPVVLTLSQAASALALNSTQTDGSQRTGILGANGTSIVSNENPVPTVEQTAVASLVAHSFSTGNLSVNTAADGATGGRFWLLNPVGSTKFIVVAKATISQAIPNPLIALATIPRVAIERMTYTGTSSASPSTSLKTISADPTPTGIWVNATTGITPTAGQRWISAYPPSTNTAGLLTSVAVTSEPVGEQRIAKSPIVLVAGEGLVIRQADAGSNPDGRTFSVEVEWYEVDTLAEARALIRAVALAG